MSRKDGRKKGGININKWPPRRHTTLPTGGTAFSSTIGQQESLIELMNWPSGGANVTHGDSTDQWGKHLYNSMMMIIIIDTF